MRLRVMKMCVESQHVVEATWRAGAAGTSAARPVPRDRPAGDRRATRRDPRDFYLHITHKQRNGLVDSYYFTSVIYVCHI